MKSSSLLRAGGGGEGRIEMLSKNRNPHPRGFILPSGGVEGFKSVFFGIIWIMVNSICKIWGKGDHLLSFHGVNVCLNL